MRAALGARRWHVLRRLLVESFVLAVAAGVLGALLAAWGTTAAVALTPDGALPRHVVPSVDPRVLFNTLSMPILRGRPFTSEDGPASPLVAIVTESGAKRIWRDEDAVSRRFAYVVGLSRGEIAIRLALGARGSGIVGLIVRNGLTLVVAGLVIGAAGAVLAGRSLEAQLFQTTPTDPGTYAAVAAALLLVSLIASALPARRAVRVSPHAALGAD